MTDWTAYADRCLSAPKPDDRDNEDLNNLCRDICKEMMPRDDYPLIGVLTSDAIVLGRLDSAIMLVEHLYPGWGYQVGRPLTVREYCGWYASVFRERKKDEPWHPHPGSYEHCAERPWKYANDASLAVMAALCRLLATETPGISAIAA